MCRHQAAGRLACVSAAAPCILLFCLHLHTHTHLKTHWQGVDISTFINNLPGGVVTSSFRSDDASGSTSQAANIQVLLLDGGCVSVYVYVCVWRGGLMKVDVCCFCACR